MIKPEPTIPCNIVHTNINILCQKYESTSSWKGVLTAYKILHSLTSNPSFHAAGLCSTNAAKIADCAPPTKHIHAVSESCAGYLLNVIACMFKHRVRLICPPVTPPWCLGWWFSYLLLGFSSSAVETNDYMACLDERREVPAWCTIWTMLCSLPL